MATRRPSRPRDGGAWGRLSTADRRRILRAVNRMRALEDPREAAMAVEVAQRQRRMWRRWWWVIPLLGGLLALPGGVEVAATNAVVGGVLVGVLAAAFSWRAGRSAELNQAVVDAARKPRASRPRKGGGKRAKRSRKGGRR
jgi:hypothetical protein